MDSEGNLVKKLPRKPQGSQPILRCHCVEVQRPKCELSNMCRLDCGGRTDFSVYNCSCSLAWHVVYMNNIKAELNVQKVNGVNYNT